MYFLLLLILSICSKSLVYIYEITQNASKHDNVLIKSFKHVRFKGLWGRMGGSLLMPFIKNNVLYLIILQGYHHPMPDLQLVLRWE